MNMEVNAINVLLITIFFTRIVGIAIFTDFYIQFREQKYLFLLCGWLLYTIAVVFNYFSGNSDLNLMCYGLLSVEGICFIFIGILFFFKSITKWILTIPVIILIAVLIGYFLKDAHNANIISLIFQTSLMLTFTFLMIKNRKSFVKIAGQSQKWINIIILLGLLNAIGYFTIFNENNIYIPYLIIIISNILVMIFLIELQNNILFLKSKEDQRMLNTLISNLNGLVYRRLNSPKIEMLFLNDGIEELTGYSKQEMMNSKDIKYSDIIDRDDREFVLNEYQKALSKKKHYEIFYRIVCKKGKKKWVYEKGKGVYNSDGELQFLEGFITDITLMKQMEEQIARTEKMNAIGHLAGGIAHDFNNQITAILSVSEMIENKYENEDDLIKSIKLIKRSARRSSELTTKLLAFARKGKHRIEDISLHSIIKEVTLLLKHSIKKDITIVEKLNAENDIISCDSGQIQNAIMNLALNANDAMTNIGTLSFITENVFIEEKENAIPGIDKKSGNYILLSIIDMGSGMDKETINQIFEPFFTTKEPGKGTGMGLAAVYGTVESHRGYIDVISEIGKGSEFKLYLPIV